MITVSPALVADIRHGLERARGLLDDPKVKQTMSEDARQAQLEFYDRVLRAIGQLVDYPDADGEAFEFAIGDVRVTFRREGR
jgi:hypothetical protein